MVYRDAAEDDDAKRDAAEVAELAARLHAMRFRVWLLTGAILLVSLGAFALMTWGGLIVWKPAPAPYPPNCHEVLVMVPGEDGKVVTTRQIDCTVPSAPPP